MKNFGSKTRLALVLLFSCVAPFAGPTSVSGQSTTLSIDCSRIPLSAADGFDLPVRGVGNDQWTVTNKFGDLRTNTEPGFTFLPPGCWHHTGEDYLLGGDSRKSALQEIYAAANGVVIFSTKGDSNPLPTRGGLVIIKHTAPVGTSFRIPPFSMNAAGEGCTGAARSPESSVSEVLSYYLHLGEIFVSKGDKVSKANRIAKLYSCADFESHKYAYIPHVHFEIWKHCSSVERNGYDLAGEQFQGALDQLLVYPSAFVQANRGTAQAQGQVRVSPDCGPPGTLFELQWTGFTPNKTLTSHLRKPDGTEFPAIQFNTDSQGASSQIVDSSKLTIGTYQHFAVDDATRSMSNVVSFDLTGMSGDAAITFGDNIPFERASPLTFCARVNDTVSIRLAVTPINGTVGLDLVDSTGQRVGTTSSHGGNVRLDLRLLRSGNFRIIPRVDCCGTGSLNVQRVNNPSFARSFACGNSIVTFHNFGERHTYTFNGNTGDKVTITMSRGPTGGINPFLELYDPDGRLLAIQPPSGTKATISNLTLTKAGRFTILASDDSYNFGPYMISLQCQP